MSPAAADAALEKRAYSKVFWRLVPFLMLCYVIAYLDRVNVGFAKLQMGQDLGFSETVFGLGAGIFFLGYFLFEVPSNLLLNRVGARIWIARIMITWGLLSACFMFVKTPTSFYILRFLLGLAEAGFYPGVILYLTHWYPAHRRARIIAVFMSAIPVAGIFGNPLSGWIMDSFHGVSAMSGWQWMFLIEAIPAVLIGLMVLFYLDNGIAQARWLNAEEKALLQREVASDAVHGAKGPHSVAGVFRDARIWWMAFIYFAFVMGQYALTFWLPTLVKATGVQGNLNIGLLSAIPFLCVPAMMGAVGFTVAASYTQNTAVSLAFLSLAAAGVLTCAPLFWSLPTAFLTGTAAAAGIAAINSVGNLAGFVSPYLIGYLKDLTGSTQIGMYVLAGALVLGAIAVWFTPKQLVNR
jgi:MFS family permease